MSRGSTSSDVRQYMPHDDSYGVTGGNRGRGPALTVFSHYRPSWKTNRELSERPTIAAKTDPYTTVSLGPIASVRNHAVRNLRFGSCRVG